MNYTATSCGRAIMMLGHSPWWAHNERLNRAVVGTYLLLVSVRTRIDATRFRSRDFGCYRSRPTPTALQQSLQRCPPLHAMHFGSTVSIPTSFTSHRDRKHLHLCVWVKFTEVEGPRHCRNFRGQSQLEQHDNASSTLSGQFPTKHILSNSDTHFPYFEHPS